MFQEQLAPNSKQSAHSSHKTRMAGTLVMCPGHIHAQWCAEAVKFCPSLTVVGLRSVAELRLTACSKIASADVVVIAYDEVVNAEYAELLKDMYCSDRHSASRTGARKKTKGEGQRNMTDEV